MIFQLRNHTEQQKLSSLMHLCEINRDLISLGFDHPKLFNVLLDMENTDPVWGQRYLQLWLNQLSLIHAYLDRGLVPKELEESLERDARDLFSNENMQRHWRRYGHFYPKSFVRFIERLAPGVTS